MDPSEERQRTPFDRFEWTLDSRSSLYARFSLNNFSTYDDNAYHVMAMCLRAQWERPDNVTGPDLQEMFAWSTKNWYEFTLWGNAGHLWDGHLFKIRAIPGQRPAYAETWGMAQLILEVMTAILQIMYPTGPQRYDLRWHPEDVRRAFDIVPLYADTIQLAKNVKAEFEALMVSGEKYIHTVEEFPSLAPDLKQLAIKVIADSAKHLQEITESMFGRYDDMVIQLLNTMIALIQVDWKPDSSQNMYLQARGAMVALRALHSVADDLKRGRKEVEMAMEEILSHFRRGLETEGEMKGETEVETEGETKGETEVETEEETKGETKGETE